MNGYLIDMILCGMAYVVIVYFMMKLVRPSGGEFPKDDNEDGGISWDRLPDLDLPPGVTLPDGDPTERAKQTEQEELVM